MLLATLLVPLPLCVAQDSEASPQAVTDRPLGADAGSPAASQPAFSKEQIAQLVAPLALYPDSLLTQIFMASTYPLEVVQADRFVKANSTLQGDDLGKQLEQQPWDPSVKSLVNFPKVLSMMSDQLDTTVQIGNAFLAQQQDVLAAVQDLRQRAQAAGNLKSDAEVNVQPSDTGGAGDANIAITPTQDSVTYVPNYDPTTIYGTWPYPNYSPCSYYPSGYGYGGLVYGTGIGFGVPWGYAFGRFDWHRRWIDYDFDRNSRYDHYVDRNHWRDHYEHVFAERHDDNDHGGPDHWVHDPRHRDGVPYGDPRDAQRFGGRLDRGDQRARDAYRGRDNSPTIVNNSTVVRNDNRTETRVDNRRTETRIDNNRTDVRVDRDRNDSGAKGNDGPIIIRRGDASRDDKDDRAPKAVAPRDNPRENASSPRVTPHDDANEVDRSAADERAAAQRGRESRGVGSPMPQGRSEPVRSAPEPRVATPEPRAAAPATPRNEPAAARPAAPPPRVEAPHIEAPSGGRSAPSPAPAAPSGGERRGH